LDGGQNPLRRSIPTYDCVRATAKGLGTAVGRRIHEQPDNLHLSIQYEGIANDLPVRRRADREEDNVQVLHNRVLAEIIDLPKVVPCFFQDETEATTI
jgi:hypothetical protein